MATNYVDPTEFYNLMCDYKQQVNQNLKENKPLPKIPERIGEMFLLIAQNTATLFHKIPFKDELIGDAVETMVKYAHKFDSDKFNNPFGYFTQFAKFSFFKTIKKEKKHYHTLIKLARQIDTSEVQDHDVDEKYFNHFIEYAKNYQFDEDDILVDEVTKIQRKHEKQRAENTII